VAEKRGADQALWKIAQELHGKLKASLRRYARDQADCEDLMQRTYERLLSTRLRSVVHAPENYIQRTVRNIGIDHLRQQRPEACLSTACRSKSSQTNG
jgi:DNA-directed RNA polymerase specialized sigma24 family protein